MTYKLDDSVTLEVCKAIHKKGVAIECNDGQTVTFSIENAQKNSHANG